MSLSVSAYLDIYLAKKAGFVFSAEKIIRCMLDNGWRILHKEVIFFLPVGDIDEYDWQEEKITENDFFVEIVKKKESAKEIIGVDLYWKETEVGVSMLMFPSYELSFSASINRMSIDLPEISLKKKINITDVSWYLNAILPCFETVELSVSKYVFSQTC